VRTTKIFNKIPREGLVILKIYDARGNEAAVPVREVQSAGCHEIALDGSRLANGIYFQDTGRRIF
jgi:hypothetical protein